MSDLFTTTITPRLYKDRRTGKVTSQFSLSDIHYMDEVNPDGSLYVQPKKKRINYKKMSFGEILQARVDNHNHGYR